MKISIWDILTGLTLLGIICLVGIFMVVAMNPAMGINPLKPLVTVAPLILPTATATELGLPPTWTPVPRTTQAEQNQPGTIPTLRPSRTPEPTSTPVILPTFTPSKTVRVGTTGGGGTTTGGGQGGGNCQIVYQNPKDDAVMAPGASFDTRWTIKNTSSNSWRADSIDLRYMSGSRMHLGSDARDIPYDVSKDGAIDILINMRAPTSNGTYTSNWALLAGNTAVCRFYVSIEVDN